MVNTWKNIHKNNTFGKKYKQCKIEQSNLHYSFELIEKIGPWGIYYDNFHNIYSICLGGYGFERYYKSKKTAKQFISKHYNYSIYDLKGEILS